MTSLKRKQRDFRSSEESALRKKLLMAKPGMALQIQASRDAAILRQIKSRPLQRNGNLKQETGYVDLVSAQYVFDTTGSITLIATVAQGASVNQRIGKKIRWESIQLRGQTSSNSATTISDGAAIFIYDKRPTGSLPAITDILVSADSNSLNNDTNSGRFQILRRLNFLHLGNSGTPSTGREGFDVNEFFNVKRQGVFKAAGTGAIGDIEEGALYMVTTGNAVAGTGASKIQVSIRVRYRDI